MVSGASPDRTIPATNFEFSQSSLSVEPGTVIRFVNQEGSHTVTLDTTGIDRTISGSDSVTLRFNEGGSYQIYCKFHGSPGSGMHSDVTVST
ncbi:MAG: plastocyanin/azurin family copper-binding protein [Candidatus Nanohalobium sp.]